MRANSGLVLLVQYQGKDSNCWSSRSHHHRSEEVLTQAVTQAVREPAARWGLCHGGAAVPAREQSALATDA